MLLADYCIEFKDGHFSASNRKRNFPLSFEFLLCLFFYSLYELNLDNNEAASNNACGFIIGVSCNFRPYSTINFFVMLPSMTV